MSTQTLPLFDPERARELKDEGQSKALITNHKVRHPMLEIARSVARSYARMHGTVTADDVRLVMCGDGKKDLGLGYHWGELGNAAGSIFRGNDFEECGVRKSGFASTHARKQTVWRLK